MTVRQQKEESLREYVGRFNQEMLVVDDVDDKVAVTAFMSGIRPGKLLFSLSKRPPLDMAELMLRAQRHRNAEDAMSAQKESERGSSSRTEKKRLNSSKDERDAKTSRGGSQSRARIEDKREHYRELD